MNDTNITQTLKTPSDAPLYKNSSQNQLLTIRKKLLTISVTADFVSKNIENPFVRDTAIDDLYGLVQDLYQLIENFNYHK